MDKHTATSTTSTPLGHTLSALGFKARPGAIDRLFTCKDALPFLHAISTTFDSSCVLTPSETSQHAHLLNRSTTPHPENINQISSSSPFPTHLKPPPFLGHDEATELVTAARLDVPVGEPHHHHHHADNNDHDELSDQTIQALQRRLEFVTKQTETLKQLIADDSDDEQDEENYASAYDNYRRSRVIVEEEEDLEEEEEEEEECIEDEESDPHDDVLALRDKLTSLLYELRPTDTDGHSGVSISDNVNIEDEHMQRYIDCEHNVLQHVSNMTQNHMVIKTVGQEEPKNDTLGALIDSYARLRADTVRQKALHIRLSTSSSCSTSSPIVYSSSLSSPKSSLARQFESRCDAAAMAADKHARRALTDALACAVARRQTRAHAKRAHILENAVAQLSVQMVRLLAVCTEQTRVAHARAQLFEALGILSSTYDVKQETKEEAEIETGVENQTDRIGAMRIKSELELEQQVAGEETIMNEHINVNNDIKKRKKKRESALQLDLQVDEEERQIFDEAYSDAWQVLEQYREQIGCRREWIDIDMDPGTKALVSQWESQLASNTLVLETILKSRDRLLQESTTTSTSCASASATSMATN